MANSTIPNLKRQLVDRLQARATLRDVQVEYGAPLPEPDRAYIWVSPEVRGRQAFAALGKRAREETYSAKVVIDVVVEGHDQEAADTRCFELMTELEDELRDDPTVNGAVRTAEVGEFVLEELAGSDARGARLTVDVDCAARI